MWYGQVLEIRDEDGFTKPQKVGFVFCKTQVRTDWLWPHFLQVEFVKISDSGFGSSLRLYAHIKALSFMPPGPTFHSFLEHLCTMSYDGSQFKSNT